MAYHLIGAITKNCLCALVPARDGAVPIPRDDRVRRVCLPDLVALLAQELRCPLRHRSAAASDQNEGSSRHERFLVQFGNCGESFPSHNPQPFRDAFESPFLMRLSLTPKSSRRSTLVKAVFSVPAAAASQLKSLPGEGASIYRRGVNAVRAPGSGGCLWRSAAQNYLSRRQAP
jgi:hypothetical protein